MWGSSAFIRSVSTTAATTEAAEEFPPGEIPPSAEGLAHTDTGEIVDAEAADETAPASSDAIPVPF